MFEARAQTGCGTTCPPYHQRGAAPASSSCTPIVTPRSSHSILGLSSVSQPDRKRPQGSRRLGRRVQGEGRSRLCAGLLRLAADAAMRSDFGPEWPTTGFRIEWRQGGERPRGPQHAGGSVLLPPARWANPFTAEAAEATAQPGSPHPGSWPPAAWGGLGNGRSGQTGFRSWARNPRGLAGAGCGRLNLAKQR